MVFIRNKPLVEDDVFPEVPEEVSTEPEMPEVEPEVEKVPVAEEDIWVLAKNKEEPVPETGADEIPLDPAVRQYFQYNPETKVISWTTDIKDALNVLPFLQDKYVGSAPEDEKLDIAARAFAYSVKNHEGLQFPLEVIKLSEQKKHESMMETVLAESNLVLEDLELLEESIDEFKSTIGREKIEQVIKELKEL